MTARAATVLRWLATLAAPALAYAACVLLALLLFDALAALCPPEAMVSGMCTAPWYGPAETAAMSVALALGAALFVALPAACAPAHRRAVAGGACAGGLLLVGSALVQIGASFAAPAAAAAVAGVATLALLLRRVAWMRPAPH